jgi:hypothetical protein
MVHPRSTQAEVEIPCKFRGWSRVVHLVHLIPSTCVREKRKREMINTAHIREDRKNPGPDGPSGPSWPPPWMVKPSPTSVSVTTPPTIDPRNQVDHQVDHPGPHLDRAPEQPKTVPHATDPVVDAAESECRQLFFSRQWQAAWIGRHKHPKGHEAAERGVRACLEAAQQRLSQGDVEEARKIASLALRVASGEEFDKARA